jgi:hypothetical protein
MVIIVANLFYFLQQLLRCSNRQLELFLQLLAYLAVLLALVVIAVSVRGLTATMQYRATTILEDSSGGLTPTTDVPYGVTGDTQ